MNQRQAEIKSKYGPDDFVRIAEKKLEMWSQPLYKLPLSDFLSIYSPAVEWFDHAFMIHRKGHIGIEMLRERWLTANQPYVCTMTAVHPVSTGIVVELVARGTFAKDLYTMKANGKSFAYHACLVMDINPETGLIEKVQEYYTKPWYDSVDIDGYRVDEKKEGAPGLPSSA